MTKLATASAAFAPSVGGGEFMARMPAEALTALGRGVSAVTGTEGAVACGCVVVSAEAGGLAEAIGGCGLVVPSGDARPLAAGLHLALGDADLRHHIEMAAPGRLAESMRKVRGAALPGDHRYGHRPAG